MSGIPPHHDDGQPRGFWGGGNQTTRNSNQEGQGDGDRIMSKKKRTEIKVTETGYGKPDRSTSRNIGEIVIIYPEVFEAEGGSRRTSISSVSSIPNFKFGRSDSVGTPASTGSAKRKASESLAPQEEVLKKKTLLRQKY